MRAFIRSSKRKEEQERVEELALTPGVRDSPPASRSTPRYYYYCHRLHFCCRPAAQNSPEPPPARHIERRCSPLCVIWACRQHDLEINEHGRIDQLARVVKTLKLRLFRLVFLYLLHYCSNLNRVSPGSTFASASKNDCIVMPPLLSALGTHRSNSSISNSQNSLSWRLAAMEPPVDPLPSMAVRLSIP